MNLAKLFTDPPEQPLLFDEKKAETGLSIRYTPLADGHITLEAISDTAPAIVATFPKSSVDEAHILYMEATELLTSRAKIHQDPTAIRASMEQLIGAFRGEKVPRATPRPLPPSGNFVANPGKSLEIDVDGVSYLRLPVKTRLITLADTDIVPLIEEYAKPYMRAGDILFVSEKALTITQGRVVDMSDIHPTAFARFLARNVGNYYGSSEFRGFGHGTALAMQLFVEEAGYPRAFLAALVSAITRPLGIRGMFYRICGTAAKSIDCPMSFLILEYAHAAKLAPRNSSKEARRIKASVGSEVVILDANYRGAFSLGKSSRALSESFIAKLFRDNPLGQSDEMTPFCIVRKKENAR